ncbi:MAG TPA: methyltransferase domain-containing protein, partial [Nocardioides sp.]|nr:methyltransferase domain-containing protein [Nocardioides sp.]
MTATLPAGEVFSHALRGETCYLSTPGRLRMPLPVADWTRASDGSDELLLRQCVGPTIDIGCGPGRMAAELAARGHVTLGIDIVGEAVRQTVDRGAAALQRDVFARVPGEGRWATALLADGNIGIGGDPAALLTRARRLLHPGGRVVV